MNWKIEVKPTAVKQYSKLDSTIRKRIKNALIALEVSSNPLAHPQVKPLVGQLKGDFRFRVGNYRILFTPDLDKQFIFVYAILPRGNAYK